MGELTRTGLKSWQPSWHARLGPNGVAWKKKKKSKNRFTLDIVYLHYFFCVWQNGWKIRKMSLRGGQSFKLSSPTEDVLLGNGWMEGCGRNSNGFCSICSKGRDCEKKMLKGNRGGSTDCFNKRSELLGEKIAEVQAMSELQHAHVCAHTHTGVCGSPLPVWHCETLSSTVIYRQMI